MLPGMAHCSGGEGPDNFDKMAAIESWVEQDKAPDSLVASQFAGAKPIRTRPICPYPQQAKYNGTSDPTDATSFTCVIPPLQKRATPHQGN
jgi:feruloyl esterase